MKVNRKILWITQTAVLIALLVVLQFITKPAGQFVTGSAVNLVLAVAALFGGFWCGFAVALVSPFFAYLLGIGTPFIQLVPAIAVANLVYVALMFLITRKSCGSYKLKDLGLTLAGVIVSAAAKFATIWLLVVKLIMPLMQLAEKQVTVLSLSFSWPQLVTALIGGVLAMLIAPALKKAIKSR